MSDRGWWQRQLNPQQQPQPQQQPPPQAYQQQPQYPPAPQQYPPQQVPQQQFQPQQQQFVDPNAQINIVDALNSNRWVGEGTKTETDRCPSCGGNHYFSRSQGARRGPPPAPMCADCGFNGLFEQAVAPASS